MRNPLLVAVIFLVGMFIEKRLIQANDLAREANAIAEANYHEQVAIRIELQRIANAKDREVALALEGKVIR